MNRKHEYAGALAAAVALLGAMPAAALCGPPLNFNNFQRPLDYMNPAESYNLVLVERAHFTPDVERLIRGENGPLPGDIHYTLMQFPNHHRALTAMAEWQLANPLPPDTRFFTVECYFERALAFTANDTVLYKLFGAYLHRARKLDDALAAYQAAIDRGEDSPELHYNLGLLYVDLKKYDEAREHAQKAYAAGHPLPGLRNRLKRRGAWK